MKWNRTSLAVWVAVICLCAPLMGVQATPTCEQWNSLDSFVAASLADVEEFFRATSVENVMACLDVWAGAMAPFDSSRTPLHEAAWYGASTAVIDALLAAGADLEARSDRGYTPLQQATNGFYHQNPAVIDALLAAGADLEARDEGGRTPLHHAAFNRNSVAAAVLLAAGAALEERDGRGRMPLHHAVSHDYSAVIEVLLAAGADVEARDEEGRTPLHQAARSVGDPDVLEALLAAGADLEARDQAGRTPVYGAIAADVYNYIISTMVEPGRMGTTSTLIGAGPELVPAFLEALLAAGVDLTTRDERGRTPLHEAAGSARLGIVKALLAAGADIQARDDDGQTSLHDAARSNDNPDVVETLLAAGADAAARNTAGQTPWDLAQENEALRETDAYRRLSEAHVNQ